LARPRLSRLLAAALVVVAALRAGGLEWRFARQGMDYFAPAAMRFAELARVVPPGAAVWLSDSPALEGTSLGIASYFLRQAALYGRAQSAEGALDRPLPPDALPQLALLAPREDPLPHGFRPGDAVWRSERAVLYRAAPEARALFLASRQPDAAQLAPGRSLRLRADQAIAPLTGAATGVVASAGAQPAVVALYVAALAPGAVEIGRDDVRLVARLAPGITRLEGGVVRTLDVTWSPEGDAAAPAVLLAALLEPTAGGQPAVVAPRALVAASEPARLDHGADGRGPAEIEAAMWFASTLGRPTGAAIELVAESGQQAAWWDVDVAGGAHRWLLRLDPIAGTTPARSEAVGSQGRFRAGPLAPGRYRAILAVREGTAVVARLPLFELTLCQDGARVVVAALAPTPGVVALSQ
jgi:hypothetical protein